MLEEVLVHNCRRSLMLVRKSREKCHVRLISVDDSSRTESARVLLLREMAVVKVRRIGKHDEHFLSSVTFRRRSVGRRVLCGVLWQKEQLLGRSARSLLQKLPARLLPASLKEALVIFSSGGLSPPAVPIHLMSWPSFVRTRRVKAGQEHAHTATPEMCT